MPNKNHRLVKMSRSTENTIVSVWAVLSGVISAGLASGAALLSGGLSSGAVGLLVVGPVLIWLICGQRAVGGALLAALAGAGGLALLQGAGLLPPPLESLGPRLGWVSVGLLVLCGVWVIARLRKRPVERIDSVSAEPELAETVQSDALPADGPLLLIEVSAFGRIRKFSGAVDLIPGLRNGKVASDILLDAAGVELTGGRAMAQNGEIILVSETETEAGRNLVILKTDGLTQNNDDIERQLRERTDFFAGLGHDLKSPLNAVIGFAEMMEAEIRGPMPEAYKDYPGLIRESGQTLLRLVEDMLGYARSEAGTYEIDPAPMDVTASAEAVMRQSQAEAERAGVRLELIATGEVLANADAGAVQRIWDNLVSNAIKYSPTNGLVTLAIKQRGSDVVISVTDRGAGMDAEDLARIAKPFEQGRNARGRAGTGLGLAMVKQLADLHGGKTMIRTAPGEGTQVTVTLPIATETAQKAAE